MAKRVFVTTTFETYLVHWFMPFACLSSLRRRWRRGAGGIFHGIHNQGSVHFCLAFLKVDAAFQIFSKMFHGVIHHVSRSLGRSGLFAHHFDGNDQGSHHFGLSALYTHGSVGKGVVTGQSRGGIDDEKLLLFWILWIKKRDIASRRIRSLSYDVSNEKCCQVGLRTLF